MKLYHLLSTILLCSLFGCQSIAEIKLIPHPQYMVVEKGNYPFTNELKVYAHTNFTQELESLTDAFADDFGITVIASQQQDADMELCFDSTLMPEQEEAYQLDVTADGIVAKARTEAGIFYAIQTLHQLVITKVAGEEYEVPKLNITDYPSLEYRALMLDEGRYFKGGNVVKQLLDQMALLKMNTFHWHLTDDQGWRIEIDKYPLLTQVGAYRDSTQMDWYESKEYDGVPHGGFYTKEQIRNIISYAAKRHITIVPEIDMPGHSAAAVAAYPWLSAPQNKISVPCSFGVKYDVFNVADPKVRGFLEDVISEVVELFPSEIIHIGGDEVRREQWDNCPKVNKFIKDKKLASSADLQIWFTNWISNVINKKGRTMMGWNDITGDKLHHFQADNSEGTQKLSPGTIVQFYRGNNDMLTRSAERGLKIVNAFSEFTYLDYSYEYDSIQATYDFKPISLERAYEFNAVPDNFPTELSSSVIGGSCQMWGEWIPTVESMNHQIYPRLAAYAEVLWTPREKKDYQRFYNSIQYFLNRWQREGIVYGPTVSKQQI